MAASAVEVVAGVFNAKVDVAVEIVGEETETDLVGDEAAGNHEVGDFGGVENRAGTREVALHELSENGELNLNLAQIGFVLEAGIGGGADEVADVVECEPRHDRIEVDDADGVAGFVVEHNVADFGIVMGDTFGDETCFVQIEEVIGERFASESEFDFGADVGNSGGNVGCDGRTEVGEALASVVKVGNRFMQARAGEIGELSLKVAKCEGGGSSFFKRPDDVVGGGPLDEVVAAPVAVIVVQMERVAGASGDQLQGFSTSRDGFVGYVSGHALDIFHQRGDVGEHVMIYPLENESEWLAAALGGDCKGIIDETVAVRGAVDKFGIEGE